MGEGQVHSVHQDEVARLTIGRAEQPFPVVCVDVVVHRQHGIHLLLVQSGGIGGESRDGDEHHDGTGYPVQELHLALQSCQQRSQEGEYHHEHPGGMEEVGGFEDRLIVGCVGDGIAPAGNDAPCDAVAARHQDEDDGDEQAPAFRRLVDKFSDQDEYGEQESHGATYIE